MSRARDLAAFVSNADGDIKFDTDTLFIDSSANKVGIRTDSPDTELHIAGGANPTLQLTAYEGTQDCDVQILPVRAELTGSESIMAFKTNDGTSLNEVMRLNENGNVGIGDTAPTYKCTVKSDQNSVFRLSTTGGGALNYLVNDYSIAAPTWKIQSGLSEPIAFNISTSEKLRITDSGITFNGDTAAANALDDYEEGSYTVTSSIGTVTNNSGYYTKVGNLVYVTMVVGNFSNTSSTSAVDLSLPFTSNSASGLNNHGSVMSRYLNISNKSVTAYVAGNVSNVRFYINGNGANDWEFLKYSHFNSTNAYLRCSFSYMV